MTSGIAGIDSPELQVSYELCKRVGQRYFGLLWTPGEVLLPDELRAPVNAVGGFLVWTDGIANDTKRADKKEVFAQWYVDTLADMRVGRSEHRLRRAFVHTLCHWNLDVGLVEEYLDTVQADCAVPPVFDMVADQRRYLRGTAGTLAELLTPLMESSNPDAARLMSLLGELLRLMNIFQSFPADLAAGRCYLPGEDLRRLDLEISDLQHGRRRDALHALVDIQIVRARDLLVQAEPVVGMAHTSRQFFLHALLLDAEVHLDEAERLRSRMLTDGIDSAALFDPRPFRDLSIPIPKPSPAHIAMIIDGNRRWAALHDLPVTEGHAVGMRAVLRLAHSALRLGIAHLSVYAFSTENWNRPPEEVAGMFDVMSVGITRATEWMHERGVRVRWYGRRDRIDPDLASALAIVESMTSNNTAMTLNIFADYGGRDEIAAAAGALAAEAVAGTIRPADIGPTDIARTLSSPDLPEVDLLIRTSGEQRISNFLLWHVAYAELVFEPTLWPDFGYRHLRAAITEYAGRQRRFGGTPTTVTPAITRDNTVGLAP